jgi:hypothetical protein
MNVALGTGAQRSSRRGFPGLAGKLRRALPGAQREQIVKEQKHRIQAMNTVIMDNYGVMSIGRGKLFSELRRAGNSPPMLTAFPARGSGISENAKISRK